MNKFLGVMAGAVFAFAGTLGNAATIDVSAYNTSMTLYDEVADIDYWGPLDFLIAETLGGDVYLDSYITSDPLNAILVVDGVPLLSPAVDFSIMAKMIEFLFVDDATGYLVTVDASGTDVSDIAEFEDFSVARLGLDFTNPDAYFYALGNIKLEKLTISAVPLPASFPLVLAGIGGLALVGRRRKAA